MYEAFTTLLFSWGGDTPPEAIWAGNDFLKVFRTMYSELNDLEFIEDDQDGTNGRILDVIKTLDK